MPVFDDINHEKLHLTQSPIGREEDVVAQNAVEQHVI